MKKKDGTRWCGIGVVAVVHLCAENGQEKDCSLWLWLKRVNRRQRRFVWNSECCLDVLKASRACIHPRACVCLMSYWQATETRVPAPRGKHTFHRLWLHKPVWLLGEKKYERNQSANKLRVLSQSGGKKRKERPERLWILTESSCALWQKFALLSQITADVFTWSYIFVKYVKCKPSL